MSTILMIARHGNTFGPDDTPVRVGARTDLPLVESGMMQAHQLGRFLDIRGFSPDVVYTSRLMRTKQTAQIAIEGANTHAQIIAHDFFNEIDYGPDEGMPEDKVIERIGEAAIEQWDRDAVPPPGWHVDPDALIKGWQDFAGSLLTKHHGQHILVVTSNGIARFAPHIAGNFDTFARDNRIKLATGAISLLTHTDRDGWQIDFWNLKPRDWLNEHGHGDE